MFDEETGFPSVSAAILIDQNLHVKLQSNGAPVPLPNFFTFGRDAKVTRFSMLDSHCYINHLLFWKSCDRGKFPSLGSSQISVIFVALFYTVSIYIASMLSYPTTTTLPSFSLLKKLNSKGVHALKAAEVFLHQDSISSHVILMADKMYLQKGAQFH